MAEETSADHEQITRFARQTEITPLVSVNNLRKVYGREKRGRDTKAALDDLNLELEAGRIVGLLGENGSGKTTLLKILAGVLQPSDGTATIAGQVIGPETKALTAFEPDLATLPKSIRAADAIKLYADFFQDFDPDKARELLDFLNVEQQQRFQTMSKGMKEKLQLALVMSRAARLYLLDEPISGVDPAARQALLDTILRGWNPQATLVISTHLVTDIETVLDQVIFLQKGRLLMAGDADELREKYALSLDGIFKKEYANVR